MLRKYYASYVFNTTGLPDVRFVPSSVDAYVQSGEVRTIKRIFKYLKRRLVYYALARVFGAVREIDEIRSDHKRILWINYSAPSIGDSLMDLSSRVLLWDRELHLFTHAKNLDLYTKDKWFSFASDRPKDFNGKKYDLIICDSFAPSVLLKKFRVAPTVEFCSLYRFVNGFDLHRTYFSFSRMEELLNYSNPSIKVKPHLLRPSVSEHHYDVCVAIGGEWKFRTYDKWKQVISRLVGINGLRIHLIGGLSAREEARDLQNCFPGVTSSCGNSLSEVCSDISHTKLFIGADGGLWHVATALGIPSVCLFADCDIFDSLGNRVLRNTCDTACDVMYDSEQVSNISAADVFSLARQVLERLALANVDE
jgi:hypothetical protein